MDDFEKIKNWLNRKYRINSNYTKISIEKWYNLTKQYIKSGLDNEKAGDKSAKEVFIKGYGKAPIIIENSPIQSIMVLLQQIDNIINQK